MRAFIIWAQLISCVDSVSVCVCVCVFRLYTGVVYPSDNTSWTPPLSTADSEMLFSELLHSDCYLPRGATGCRPLSRLATLFSQTRRHLWTARPGDKTCSVGIRNALE